MSTWAELNADPRQRLEYPSEHVVRWLSRVGRARDGFARAIDIGAGFGRHARLLRSYGYDTVAVDAFSPDPMVVNADMRELPWLEGTFDVAVAYGVFYYGTRQDHQAAADELYRVLRPGGHAFVNLRRTDDWRNKIGMTRDYPEFGMALDFVDQTDVGVIYKRFASVQYLRASWSQRWGFVNCDFNLELRKGNEGEVAPRTQLVRRDFNLELTK